MNVNLVKKSKQTGAIWGIILVLALVGFEVFNFSTTRFALYDLWGSLGIAGISYATIFAIVFCAIDFGGIARIFTPEGSDTSSVRGCLQPPSTQFSPGGVCV